MRKQLFAYWVFLHCLWRYPADGTGMALRSFILKLENSVVQKFCDCVGEEQFTFESFLEA